MRKPQLHSSLDLFVLLHSVRRFSKTHVAKFLSFDEFRTLRKDPAAVNGKIPLSQLVKVFNFHGLATSRSVNDGIKQSYRVDRPVEGAVNAAAAAARADFRSRSRAETSVGGKSGTKKVQTIKMKRQALSR